MGLYLAPNESKELVLNNLKNIYLCEHPEIAELNINERVLSLTEAKALVKEYCVDTDEVQPAVKLPSFLHEIVYAAWLDLGLHYYGPYNIPKNVDLKKCKFLFHHGSDRMQPWHLVVFTTRMKGSK